MATLQHYKCPDCLKSFDSDQRLFYSLLDFSKGKIKACQHCDTKLKFYLTFDFGLGVGKSESIVRDVFLPEKNSKRIWKENNNTVEFFPFLVFLEFNSELSVWLPYWHLVKEPGKTVLKYGQWAPNIDLDIFTELIKKASEKGYFANNSISAL
jgi:DNA-directed RNA polymerase subunit RPC12/RpoP